MPVAPLRYNNPGDVSLPLPGGQTFGGTIIGIQGQKDYASFPTPAAGYDAFTARVTSYIDGTSSHGTLDTISAMNRVYAQDQGWQNGVSQFSGIGLNTPLDSSNSGQMADLQYGIMRQEGLTGAQANTFQDNAFDSATWNDPNAWGSSGGQVMLASSPTNGGIAAYAGQGATPAAADPNGGSWVGYAPPDQQAPVATDGGSTATPGQSATPAPADNGTQPPAQQSQPPADNATQPSQAPQQQSQSNGGGGQSTPGNIVSGLWEYMGTVATTTGANTTAQATDNLGKTQTANTKSLNDTNTKNTTDTNKTNTDNTKQTNATNTQNTKDLTTTASNLGQSFNTILNNLFTQTSFVLLGLIFVAAGLYFLAMEGRANVPA